MEKQKKKKQHYVPQCYLEAWAIPGKHQIYVFDKQTKKQRINNISDVAEENYFYDIDLTGIMTKDELVEYGFSNCDPKNVDTEQYIENYFSNNVEGVFQQNLSRIIDRTRKMTPWEIRNCCFVSERQKIDFSYCLALQYIRVKAVRNSMLDSIDCLEQVLGDMGASQEVIKKYAVPKSQLPYIHAKMITNWESVEKFAQRYFSLTWILQINRTHQPFFTSDSPITNQPHIKNSCVSMSGLSSKGIEVNFPIAPDIILTMFDGDYHSNLNEYDRRIVEIDDLRDINNYNLRCVIHSERCIFSNKEDFSIIHDILEKEPYIFDKPHTILHCGGKTYKPRGK